jgi:DNA-binding NtrC family response regulator
MVSKREGGPKRMLLRVIQNREVQRVGSPEVRHVDVRLIAATNRDLRAEVLAGQFREDLFYRLSSIQIRIPSLMERLEDIPLLVQFFVKKYNQAYGKNISGLTRRAQTVLLQHAWPGNVRELENVVSSAAITTSGDFIDLADLPENLQHRGQLSTGGPEWRPMSLDEVRKAHIQRVLQMCMGNRLRAAQVPGHRAHQPVPLFETGPSGGSGPGSTPRGSGRIVAELKRRGPPG